MSDVITPKDFEDLQALLTDAAAHGETPRRASKSINAAAAMMKLGETTYEDFTSKILVAIDKDGYNTREDYVDHLAEDLPEELRNKIGYED